MRRMKRGVALMLTAGLALGLGGCVESDPDEASTPEDTPTVVNSAPQTDSTGSTIAAPGAETPTEETPTDDGGGEADPEAVAAGKTYFETTCQGCHNNLGTEAGVGPVLAGGGRAADLINNTVVNGKGAMPAGLASGADLENVVAFVLSIQ